LLEILKLFEKNSISALSFKGPLLAESAYGDISLRQFVDLDILVSQDDVFKACSLLIEQGYRIEPDLSEAEILKFIEIEDGVTAEKDEIGAVIELHWEMTGRYSFVPVYLNSIRNRIILKNLSGMEVSCASPEDMLLYLCIHGAKDTWECIGLVSCVAELLRSSKTLNWALVFDLALKKRAMRMLLLGLYLANDLLCAPVPERITAKIDEDKKLKKLAEDVYRNLFNEKDPVLKRKIILRFSIFHLRVRDKFIDGIVYGLRLLVVPTVKEWVCFPLPASLSFLHYFLRPVRLIFSFFRILLSQKGSCS
jgi:hypothetical protein